ncbi:MAG: hypothetical protein PHE82_07190 [Syntrophomonadaceae bacterium]|nr:hypothetical protein [Syntrophomonadaceae bacterium]
MEQVYRAIRNHYRLIKLYNRALKNIEANINRLNFYPSKGVPNTENDESESLKDWKTIIEDFRYCLPEQLLSTFMPEARNESYDSITQKKLKVIRLEMLDLTNYNNFLGKNKFQTDEEKIFNTAWNRT